MLSLEKASDINREFAVFELLAGDKVVLDAGYSDKETFEIAFHKDITGMIIEWATLKDLIKDGKKMAELDRL